MLYGVKALLTRTRSLVWLARTRGRPDGKALRILLYHRVGGGSALEIDLDAARFAFRSTSTA